MIREKGDRFIFREKGTGLKSVPGQCRGKNKSVPFSRNYPDRVIDEIRDLLEQVADPEIPVLTIADLGILQDVCRHEGGIQVVITPTYSGCPAMQTIEHDIVTVLSENGYEDVEVATRISPPWTTDWLSEAGREKLLQYGIVPPAGSADKQSLRMLVACPRCQSAATEEISRFGSTPCKALYRCNDCLEPFDYFKCI